MWVTLCKLSARDKAPTTAMFPEHAKREPICAAQMFSTLRGRRRFFVMRRLAFVSVSVAAVLATSAFSASPPGLAKKVQPPLSFDVDALSAFNGTALRPDAAQVCGSDT